MDFGRYCGFNPHNWNRVVYLQKEELNIGSYIDELIS